MDRPRDGQFLLGLMAVLAVLAWFVVRPFLSYLAMGLVVAYLLRDPFEGLARVTRRPRLSAAVLVVVVLLLILGPVALLASLLAAELARFAATFSVEALRVDLVEAFGRFGLPAANATEALDLAAAQARAWAVGLAQDMLSAGVGVVLGLFVFFFALYYGMVEGRRWVRFLRHAVPLSRARLDRLLGEAGRALDAVFKGELGIALVQGALATAGWWLFGYPNPLLWGLVATILAVIPWTGAPFVMVPVGIWDALHGHPVRGIAFVAYAVVLVGTVDNFLRPFVIGRTGEIHPALVLIGIVGGLVAFGFAGLFLGPLVLVLLRAVLVAWAEEPGGRPRAES